MYLSHPFPQIIAVNGKSLLNLPYAESLSILQQTGRTVELVLSQIFQRPQQHQQQSSLRDLDHQQQQQHHQPRPPTVTKSNSLYIKNGSRSATATPLLDTHYNLPPAPSYTKLYEEVKSVYNPQQQQQQQQRKPDGSADSNTNGSNVASQRYTKNVADILRTRNRMALAERSHQPAHQQQQHPAPAYVGLSPSKSMPDLPKVAQQFGLHPPQLTPILTIAGFSISDSAGLQQATAHVRYATNCGGRRPTARLVRKASRPAASAAAAPWHHVPQVHWTDPLPGDAREGHVQNDRRPNPDAAVPLERFRGRAGVHLISLRPCHKTQEKLD